MYESKTTRPFNAGDVRGRSGWCNDWTVVHKKKAPEIKLFEKGDGTGRPFRKAQEYVLAKLREVWHLDNKPIVILGQTGLGKSMLARTIQLESDAAIVTPQNSLISQYLADYPELNYWWGKNHFKCHPTGIHLADCAYTQNRLKAINHQHTIFNPMSLYYLKRAVNGLKPHPTVIIDEAHAVLSMLRNLSVKEFDVSDEVAPHKLEVTYNFREWLEKKLAHAREMYEAYCVEDETRQMKTWYNKIKTFDNLLHGLNEADESYSIKYHPKTEKLEVQCTWLPSHIVENTFGSGRKILMSGTIFKPDLLELLNTDEYHLIEPPSAIPKENRKILYQPLPFKVNYMTDKRKLAYFINCILDKYAKNQRTIIHIPYSWVEEISAGLNRPSVILHDKTNKEYALAKFKKQKGGVLLACGMAEGIDLKGDLCRLNIIPKILWPNLKDDFVEKKSRQGSEGRLWYLLEAAKTVIQQAGRSTRGPEDWSTTIIMDPSFDRLITQCGEHLPQTFLEALQFYQ